MLAEKTICPKGALHTEVFVPRGSQANLPVLRCFSGKSICPRGLIGKICLSWGRTTEGLLTSAWLSIIKGYPKRYSAHTNHSLSMSARASPFPGPSIISQLWIFPHGCEIKSGRGLGTGLRSSTVCATHIRALYACMHALHQLRELVLPRGGAWRSGMDMAGLTASAPHCTVKARMQLPPVPQC